MKCRIFHLFLTNRFQMSFAVIGNGSDRCSAQTCVAQKNTFKNGEPIAFINHPISKITHLFHPECFATAACRDPKYLATGSLSKCLSCNQEMVEEQTYPSPKNLAPIAFKFFVRNRNFDDAHRLLGSPLISHEFRQWATHHLYRT